MFPLQRTQRGFTLIELLIVITIIAVLAATLFIILKPSERFAESRDAKRQADVTAIAQAMRVYEVDNGGGLPNGVDGILRMIGAAADGCAVACPIPSGSGFTPHHPDLAANLRLWLDANAIEGLNDGDFVATWQDESGNNNSVTQANAALQPRYRTGVMNGHPVVRFDGTDQLEKNGAVGLSNKQRATWFVVLSTTDGAASRVAFSAGAGNVGSFRVQKHTTNGGHRWLTGVAPSAWRYTVNHFVQPNTVYLYSATFDGTQADGDARLTLRLNGEDQQLLAGAGNPGATTGDSSRVVVGNWIAANYFWPGDIAEIIVYDRLLTAEEVRSIEAYLNTKYGLAAGEAAEMVETPAACVDIAAAVARQLPAVPMDPSVGSMARTYYAIREEGNGAITVAACGAELTSPIVSQR